MKNYIMLIKESQYYVNIDVLKNIYKMIGNEENIEKSIEKWVILYYNNS